MDFLFQKTWLPMFVSLFHLILLPLIVLCSGKKSDSSSVTPTQETEETASPNAAGNESGSKMTPEAGPKTQPKQSKQSQAQRVLRRKDKAERDGISSRQKPETFPLFRRLNGASPCQMCVSRSSLDEKLGEGS